MGGGASARKAEEAACSEVDSASLAGAPGQTAGDLADLLFGVDEQISQGLSEKQQQQMSDVLTLLAEPGWRPGSKRSGVEARYKFNRETGLFYSCFNCEVPDTARSMFEDFNRGKAQERYSDVCKEEHVLSVTERPLPLGHERLVRGIYRMPYPMKDRDFVWQEWSALLPTQDGGSLYISVAYSPDDEATLCPAEPERFVRAHLKLSATFARQGPGEQGVRAAFIIQGDIKGNMPRSLQNLLAGNASTYLAQFRDAHSTVLG
mmetsp:Transcript_120765/g.313547  ORF Transcript_120765/g.313547 Transcript_120765/m.313547 type:complete len:262 (-) Transcript_120765:206-991(-)